MIVCVLYQCFGAFKAGAFKTSHSVSLVNSSPFVQLLVVTLSINVDYLGLKLLFLSVLLCALWWLFGGWEGDYETCLVLYCIVLWCHSGLANMQLWELIPGQWSLSCLLRLLCFLVCFLHIALLPLACLLCLVVRVFSISAGACL